MKNTGNPLHPASMEQQELTNSLFSGGSRISQTRGGGGSKRNWNQKGAPGSANAGVNRFPVFRVNWALIYSRYSTLKLNRGREGAFGFLII